MSSEQFSPIIVSQANTEYRYLAACVCGSKLIVVAQNLHCANLVLVPVIPIITLVLVPVIQFLSCALLDHGVLNVMLVMLSEIEFEA